MNRDDERFEEFFDDCVLRASERETRSARRRTFLQSIEGSAKIRLTNVVSFLKASSGSAEQPTSDSATKKAAKVKGSPEDSHQRDKV